MPEDRRRRRPRARGEVAEPSGLQVGEADIGGVPQRLQPGGILLLLLLDHVQALAHHLAGVYDAYAPHIFMEGAGIAASGSLVVIAILMSIYRAREAKDVRTCGSARWAEPHEIKSAGLLGDDGVMLGKLDRDYLRHDGAEHVLCFAPTRSGKGVGLVVPTLLTWPGASIVHDGNVSYFEFVCVEVFF